MHNGRWIVATIAIAAFTTEPARGDVGFGPRLDINVRVRFDNLDDYPEYDFYLKYGLGTGNPHASLHLMRLNPAILTRLEGQGNRLGTVYLLAVPRGQTANPPPTWPHDMKWLSEVQNGAIQSPPLYLNDSELLQNHNGCSAFYRVKIEGKQMSATWVGGEEPSGSLWCVAFAGVALSAGIAVIGLVWIKRRRRRLKA